jgi:competence protein ComEA
VSRRQALGLVLLALLLAGGRLIRHYLLLGPDGAWRDPLLLESLLPPEEADMEPAREPRPSLPAPGSLPINTAPPESLVALPGVGPALAGRIAAARATGGPFHGPADLERVKGIGPRLAARMAPYLDFGACTARAETTSIAPDRGAGAAAGTDPARAAADTVVSSP